MGNSTIFSSPSAKKPRRNEEHAIQSAFFTWANLQAAAVPALRGMFAIPNGAFLGGDVKTLASGARIPMAAIRMNRLKAEGLKPGVPDVMLPVARGGFHGLFLEFKRTKGGKHSEGQKGMRDFLLAGGYRVESPTSAAQAISLVMIYLGAQNQGAKP